MAVWTIWTGDVWLSIKHPKPLGYSASPTHIIQRYYLHQRCLNYKDSQDNTQILARTFCVLIACVASIPVRLKSFLPTGRTKIGARGKNRQFFCSHPNFRATRLCSFALSYRTHATQGMFLLHNSLSECPFTKLFNQEYLLQVLRDTEGHTTIVPQSSYSGSRDCLFSWSSTQLQGYIGPNVTH